MMSGQGWAGGPDGGDKRLGPALTEPGQGGGSTWCDSKQSSPTVLPRDGALAASSVMAATTAQVSSAFEGPVLCFLALYISLPLCPLDLVWN